MRTLKNSSVCLIQHQWQHVHIGANWKIWFHEYNRYNNKGLPCYQIIVIILHATIRHNTWWKNHYICWTSCHSAVHVLYSIQHKVVLGTITTTNQYYFPNTLYFIFMSRCNGGDWVKKNNQEYMQHKPST